MCVFMYVFVCKLWYINANIGIELQHTAALLRSSTKLLVENAIVAD